ncbi:MAG: hypothetical protein RL621_1614 [Bacteroidota bacterium]|jgi:hypothetical protein
MKKPVQPQEYTWDLMEESEEVILSDYPYDVRNVSEFTEIEIFDDRGNNIDKVTIRKSKYKKVRNPNFEEENEIYLKAMEIYKEENARKYQKSLETKIKNANAKLAKLQRSKGLKGLN